jgi:MFS family permease
MTAPDTFAAPRPQPSRLAALVHLPVWVAALGYFVDVFDLFLFSVVRVASLRDLGIPESRWLETGVLLLNAQMAGLLLGGIVWGMLGDRRGRVSVLFGSILLYSVANLGNAFVHGVPAYAVMRFITGFGLAGEVGAAITLVAELLPKTSRGLGTMLVGGVGLLGSVAAAFTSEWMSWRASYLLGGAMGLVLLVLRLSLREPALYEAARRNPVARGQFHALFRRGRRALRFLGLIAIGLPIWYVVGILITFSPEFGRMAGLTQKIVPGRVIFYTYLGVVVGDFASGALSEALRSRRKVLFGSLALLGGLVALFLLSARRFDGHFYALCAVLGFATGYWVVLMTMVSESFGTNLRATATTAAPNLIRGGAIPITLAFTHLRPVCGGIAAAAWVGAVCLALAFVATARLPESYGRDLDYLETP